MWTNRSDLDKTILIDSDVIRHFIKGKCIDKLSLIFPHNLFILDIVEAEICRSKKVKPVVQKLIKEKALRRKKFPTNKKQIREEYLRLCSESRGNGESACMAVARFEKDIIASNNLRDIKEYCVSNGILYLTTMDILCAAYYKGIMTDADIDYCLYLNLHDVVPSKIPFETFANYLGTKPDIETLLKEEE